MLIYWRVYVVTWWLIPRIVSGLVHPNHKWMNTLQKSHFFTHCVFGNYFCFSLLGIFFGLIYNWGELSHFNSPWVVRHQVWSPNNSSHHSMNPISDRCKSPLASSQQIGPRWRRRKRRRGRRVLRGAALGKLRGPATWRWRVEVAGWRTNRGMVKYVGLSENWVYSQWNSHLIGIMVSKTIGFRGTRHFQTHPWWNWWNVGIWNDPPIVYLNREWGGRSPLKNWKIKQIWK